jgi:hypothetical protein
MEDDIEGNSVVTQLEFGRPKFQATIPERARRILGVTEDDLEYEKGSHSERVVVQAELTVKDVYVKNLGGDSES